MCIGILTVLQCSLQVVGPQKPLQVQCHKYEAVRAAHQRWFSLHCLCRVLQQGKVELERCAATVMLLHSSPLAGLQVVLVLGMTVEPGSVPSLCPLRKCYKLKGF